MSIIFSTVHGSRLYGFAHAGSDNDTFTVTDERTRPLTQKVRGDQDDVTVGINRFLQLAYSGSHQSCEALFSREKKWASDQMRERWAPMLSAAYVTDPDAYAKYERTIRAFCYGDFKRRRHACRLAANLEELRRFGEFNPRASFTQVDHWNHLASDYSGDTLAEILNVKETA